MSKDNKKIIDKLNKLLQLAEQGVGGEKATAQRMLDRMLKKNGMTLADIADEATEVYWFKYSGAIERQLLSQIIYSVSPEGKRWRKKRSKTETGAELTKRQMLDVELRFSIYKEAIKDDIKMLVDAFIQKNDIYPEDSGYAVDVGEESPEEKAKRFRTAQMANGLQRTNVLKGIN